MGIGLTTQSPVDHAQTKTTTYDSVAIESFTPNNLYTRDADAPIEWRIERLWILSGRVVDSRVVTVPADILAEEMKSAEFMAALAVISAANLRMLQAMDEAPAEAELAEVVKPEPPPIEEAVAAT